MSNQTFELGIMSNKWNVTAPNLDIATVALLLQQQTAAPIVCYSQEEQSPFGFIAINNDELSLNGFFSEEKNRQAVKDAAATIKAVEV